MSRVPELFFEATTAWTREGSLLNLGDGADMTPFLGSHVSSWG